MANHWILAADSSQARLFTREKKFGPLTEQQDWLHPESRLHGKELEDDRQGKTFSSQGYNQSEKQKPTDPKKREAQSFAHELGKFLDAAATKGEFESLSLVADPSFLGLLRDAIDSGTRKRLDRTVDKSLTRRSPETIAAAVDDDRE